MFPCKSRRVWWSALIAVVAGAGFIALLRVEAQESKEAPKKNTRSQRCTIEAYESIRIRARVPGILAKQYVDIGDRVKKGQVLAVIEAPEVEAQVRLEQAIAEQAGKRVTQVKLRVNAAKVEHEIAKLTHAQAEAAANSAAALAQLREKRWQRMKALFEAKAVEPKLLDEAKEHHVAATGAQRSALAAVLVAAAQVRAGSIKIELAEADVAAAEGDVKIAEARLDRARILHAMATIVSPIDGVVTARGYATGDFVASADKDGRQDSLFTVQRIDKMRVIAAIPDRDAAFVAVGDPAEVQIDALPGKTWPVKIARVSGSLDAKVRTMRAEFDLPNPSGLLLPGMTGTVTLTKSR